MTAAALSDRMRIAIVGCGAMGSVYAGLFAEAGHRVVALSPPADHMTAIAQRGLRLSGPGGDRVIALDAITEPCGERVDLMVVATKSAHAAEAVRGALPMISPETVVLTIQNGLGASEQVAAVIPDAQLAVGIAAAFGAQLSAPGHAHHENTGKISIGAYSTLDAARLRQVAAAWSGAGFPAESVPDIKAMQWEKLICNVAYSALCGITGHAVGQVMDSAELGPISRAAAIEAHSIALKAGVLLSVTDPVAHVLAFGERVRGAKPSVLLDIEAGRASEIGYINGAVDRVARSVGTTAPVNATLTALVRDRELREGLR